MTAVTEGIDAGAKDFGALDDAVRTSAARNALARAYGPDAADIISAPNASKNFLAFQSGRNQSAEADTSAAKLPYVGKEAEADAALRQAQAQKTTLDAANEKLRSVATIAAAALKGDPKTDPRVLFQTLSPSIKAIHPDITDEHLAQMGDAFASDPQGTLATLLNPTPKIGTGMQGDQPVITQEDALGRVSPADTKGGVTPYSPIEGAPTKLRNPDGTYTLQFKRANGQLYNHNLPKGVEPDSDYAAGVRAALQEQHQTGQTTPGIPGAPQQPAGPAPGEKPPAPGTGDKRAIPADSRYARLVTQKDKDSANDLAKQTVNVADGVAQAAPILQQVLEQITPYTTGPGVALKDLPGTVQDNLKRNLETLKANEFLTVLGGMKNKAGQSGIGRVLQSEVPMMQAAFGNMQQDQTTKQLAQHVELLRQFLARSKDKAVQSFNSAYGADAYDVMGVAPYNPKMTLPATGAAARPTPEQAQAELARRKAAAGK